MSSSSGQQQQQQSSEGRSGTTNPGVIESELQQYLAKHRVAETLQRIVERLCIEQPDNAIEFMIRCLQRLQQSTNSNNNNNNNIRINNDQRARVAATTEAASTDDGEMDQREENQDDEDEDTKDDESHLIDERRAEQIRRRYSTTHTRRDAFSSESIDPNAQFEPIMIPKTVEEKQRLHAALSSNVLFSHLDTDEIKIIFDAMFERTYTPGETIIQQGDEGDNFYVVDYGECDVLKFTGDGTASQKVTTVRQGGSFGELALIYNQPRAATVVAATDVRVWAIDRTTYKRILLGSTIKKRKLYEDFLSKVDILHSLTDYERLTIADALQPANFTDGSIIVRQDDPGDSFFIIAEGSVVVEKKLPNNNIVQIGTLETGAFFGELALLFNQPRAATILANGFVKCLTLDKKSFDRLLGPSEDILKRNVAKYNEIVAKFL